ncbi:MAG: DUF4430 domain-containing protein [Clostridia bacterium]|nr:DUF4430 domain-containing protein [Clostridia bacterium]
MQKTRFTKQVSLLVCTVLIAAIALFASGCNNTTPPAAEEKSTVEAPETQATVLGEGKTSFNFTVKDGEGNVSSFIIKTDKTVVGEALQELGLIEGEESQYGLYVKKVNGITADYDTTGTYWAFYINGEMAPTGVDMTEIVAGESYGFVVSK